MQNTHLLKLATDDMKNKLPWVATVIAELLDQNNDGCRDDPNVEKAMRNSLQKFKLTNFVIKVGSGKGRIETLRNPPPPPQTTTTAPIGGLFSGESFSGLGLIQTLDKADVNPKCTKAGKFKSCPTGFECAKVGYKKSGLTNLL